MADKGQGLPITTIIIAALGILVLVVVAAIFGGQIGKFGRIAGECPGRCAGPTWIADAKPDAETMAQACDHDFEKALSGTYIDKGQTGTKPDQVKKCVACCIPRSRSER